MGMADGQPHDCVTVARPRQAGMAHVVHSSRVAVTVGQPVCVMVGKGPVPRTTLVRTGELALPLGSVVAQAPVLVHSH